MSDLHDKSEAVWPSGHARGIVFRGRGFDPRHCYLYLLVSCHAKIFKFSPISRKRTFRFLFRYDSLYSVVPDYGTEIANVMVRLKKALRSCTIADGKSLTTRQNAYVRDFCPLIGTRSVRARNISCRKSR